jgi:hypothetical protein
VSKSYYGAKKLPLYYETTKEFNNRSRNNKAEQQPTNFKRAPPQLTTSKELHHN